MCTTCGCGGHAALIGGKPMRREPRKQGGAVAYRPFAGPKVTEAAHDAAQARIVRVERDLLAKNDALAADNRAVFAAHHILALNLVSSPGSGKTTLLVRTLQALKEKFLLAVIEGDQQTDFDAERIRATGVEAIQINTGKGCHLDAEMVGHALQQMALPEGGILFIENVGNLVCPAAFDLGEAAKVVVLSVTEGEDKPLKYPDMFRAAKLMLLNKCDLLPYLSFDVAQAVANARRVNPDIEIIQLSASSGEGMAEWLGWLERQAGAELPSPAGGRGVGGEGLQAKIPFSQTLTNPHPHPFSRLREKGAVASVISLPSAGPSVLACGAWLKNTVCVTRGSEAYVSQLIGDLGSAEMRQRLDATVASLCEELDVRPEIVAHDLHPDFYSSQFAQTYAAQHGLPVIAVQHHHAHIAAICAEHNIGEAVLGLALDGVGLGTDNTPWGGELLRVAGADFQRLGHLAPLRLPGGDRAATEPWRMAAAALSQLGRGDEIARRFATQPGAQTVATMLQRSLNCPITSSTGRLFDAVAGLLGVSEIQAFEAQAAIQLQALAQRHGPVAPLEEGFRIDENGVLDFLPLLAALADCRDAGYGAAQFHATLAAGLAELTVRAAHQHNIAAVALGGGCFHNEILLRTLSESLAAQELRVLTAQQMQPNDSAISLGQAWVALQSINKGL